MRAPKILFLCSIFLSTFAQAQATKICSELFRTKEHPIETFEMIIDGLGTDLSKVKLSNEEKTLAINMLKDKISKRTTGFNLDRKTISISDRNGTVMRIFIVSHWGSRFELIAHEYNLISDKITLINPKTGNVSPARLVRSNDKLARWEIDLASNPEFDGWKIELDGLSKVDSSLQKELYAFGKILQDIPHLRTWLDPLKTEKAIAFNLDFGPGVIFKTNYPGSVANLRFIVPPGPYADKFTSFQANLRTLGYTCELVEPLLQRTSIPKDMPILEGGINSY